MKPSDAGKRNFLLLILILGLFILLMGTLISSCGVIGPQEKVIGSNRGAYAVDFPGRDNKYISVATQVGGVGLQVSALLNSTFTVEAWIKTSSAALRTIFSRGTNSGIVLFVDDGTNCAGVSNAVVFSDGTSYVCSSAVVNNGAWHHVAGVFVNQDHASVHADCTAVGSGGSRSDMPHLDLYVDGTYQDCASPFSSGNYPLAIDTCTGSDRDALGNVVVVSYKCSNKIGVNQAGTGGEFINDKNGVMPGAFVGTIDEVRLWGVAKTSGQIQQCRLQELSVTEGGTCGIDYSILHGYWRFNEGAGATVSDASGRGLNGSKLFCAADCGTYGETFIDWTGGWVTGYIF